MRPVPQWAACTSTASSCSPATCSPGRGWASVYWPSASVPRFGTWGAALAALGGYLVTVAVVMSVLPTASETPQPITAASGMVSYPGFPADDLYEFRLHALGIQVIIWATIGVAFGAMASRLLESQRPQHITA